MLLDIQGVGYLLCDPEIAAIDLRVKMGGTKNKFYFCLENLSTSAIHGFMSTHKCNRICRTLGSKNLKMNSFKEDGEAGKVQKEKKDLSYLVLSFIATFILQKATTKNICELLRWKALNNCFSHKFATPE